MIIVKGVLLGIGLSVLGTVTYIFLLMWWSYRRARLLYPTGGIGFNINSLRHDLGPAYYLLVAGLMAVGIAIVALWPRAVPTP
jgi:hypothetical protein